MPGGTYAAWPLCRHLRGDPTLCEREWLCPSRAGYSTGPRCCGASRGPSRYQPAPADANLILFLLLPMTRGEKRREAAEKRTGTVHTPPNVLRHEVPDNLPHPPKLNTAHGFLKTASGGPKGICPPRSVQAQRLPSAVVRRLETPVAGGGN